MPAVPEQPIRISTGFAPRAIALARRVLGIEADAIQRLAERIDERFAEAVNLVLACQGRVIVSGIGKSGHIARKLAATLASTGTPAYFVHSAEAAHGDLGMITDADIVIGVSNSGFSEELMFIVPLVKRRGAKLISLCGNPNSPLAEAADVHLDASVAEEACPLNLAPTASTTAALALGDALAVALLDARGFSEDDFARSHPGGSLGRRLLTRVHDVMRPLKRLPLLSRNASFADLLLQMTRGGMGMAIIVDDQQRLQGIFTDGDLRRCLERGIDLRTADVTQLMTRNPHTLDVGSLAVDAASHMEKHRISQLIITDPDGSVVGALTTHDLMQAKVI